jgi:hypothetical protein
MRERGDNMKAKYLFAMLTVVTALFLPRPAQAQSCSNGTCEVWAVYDPTYNTISGYFTYDNYEGFWVLLDAYIYDPNWKPTHLGGAVDEVSAEVDFSYTPAISGNYYLLGVNQYEVEDDYGWTFDGYSSTTVWGGPPPPYISSCTLEGPSWVDGQNTIYCTGQFLTNSVSVTGGGPEGGYFLGSSSTTVDGSGDDMTITVSLGEILYNGAWITIADAGGLYTMYLPEIEPPLVDISCPPGIPAGGGSGTCCVDIPDGVEEISLTLGSNAGSGSATFADGSTFTTIYESGSVSIVGGQASSQVNNITLAAYDSTGSASFSVVSVSISLNTSTPIQNDIQLANFSSNILPPNPPPGTRVLGAEIFYNQGQPWSCIVGVELVGTVIPSGYAGQVTLRRNIVSTAAFIGQSPYQDPGLRTGPDDSSPGYLDSTVGGGAPGQVFDLDPPGVGPQPTGPERYRTNFQEYAVLGDLTSGTVVGQSLNYYVAVSCGGTLSSPSLDTAVQGDNVANTGVVPLSWNLR